MDDHQLTDALSGAPPQPPDILPAEPDEATAAAPRLDLRQPIWYLVLVLAVPALLQQMLAVLEECSDFLD